MRELVNQNRRQVPDVSRLKSVLAESYFLPENTIGHAIPAKSCPRLVANPNIRVFPDLVEGPGRRGYAEFFKVMIARDVLFVDVVLDDRHRSLQQTELPSGGCKPPKAHFVRCALIDGRDSVGSTFNVDLCHGEPPC